MKNYLPGTSAPARRKGEITHRPGVRRGMRAWICAAACVLLVCALGAARAETAPAGIINVLLLGVDRNEDGARTGAVLILTADTVHGGIRLTSVLADLRPEIGGGTLSEIYDAGGADAFLGAAWADEAAARTAAVNSRADRMNKAGP